MSSSSSTRRHLYRLAAARALTGLAALAAAGCRRSEAEASGGATTGRAETSVLHLQSPNPDPCALVPLPEVERTLGPLKSDAVRVESARRGDPDADGLACVYQLQDSPTGSPRAVAVEVVMHDPATLEDIGDAAPGEIGDAAPGAADHPWDAAFSIAGRSFAARQGDVGVIVNVQAKPLADGAVAELAARFLERIPDLPVAGPAPTPGQGESATDDRSSRDPCGLLTREEAETVLGKLVAPPHRARVSTALADSGGSSCAYHSAGHRVLILTPTWAMGRATFGVLRTSSQSLAKLFDGARAADTLGGGWDAAASSLDRSLVLLKGDRMLEVKYGTSSTDAAGALALARAALRRL